MSLLRQLLGVGVLLGLLSLAAACNAAEKPRTPMNNAPMITHHIGRFMIQVPQSMEVARRSARLRFRELEDVKWPSTLAHEKAQDAAWQLRLDQIQKMSAPKGKPSALIEKREISKSQPSIQAIRYFGDNDDEEINWDTLVDAGTAGLWIKSRGLIERAEKIIGHDLDIARAYHPLDPAAPLPKETAFYLEHGYIALPYLEQEAAYARFEGHPLGLKLRIQTNEIHEDEAHDEGLLGRLAATLATGFAAGVDIEKIRTGKREVGGLKGEETVLRAKTKDKTDLSFLWRYAGKKDSGDHPEIVIEIEAKDGQLEEKLKLWDAILNSMKPAVQ
jgi:hypothetical protein